RLRGIEPVEVDEVGVRRVDPLTPISDARTAHQRRINGLGVAAGEPARGPIETVGEHHRPSPVLSRSLIVESTLMRVKRLSSASTSVQGAVSVLVRSTM